MASHMYPGEAKGPDYHLNNRSASTERMSIQSILSCSGSSEIHPICDGSSEIRPIGDGSSEIRPIVDGSNEIHPICDGCQLSRHLPLPDLRDSVSASMPTNTGASVEHRHLDSALRPGHSTTFPLPGAKERQQTENKSSNRHIIYQGNEAVGEDLDNSEAKDEVEEGVSPGAHEGEETSLSSVLAVLDEDCDEFFTSQLHAYCLPHLRARYRHQQRAAAMRYPVSLPLARLPRTDQDQGG
ncbi:hypothetical protein E4U14_007640 [Claviceps sp. LM454 group G7]|nr:hypothetical protein E4U14_007640 [Claviceps sp. LM454 group G7]